MYHQERVYCDQHTYYHDITKHVAVAKGEDGSVNTVGCDMFSNVKDKEEDVFNNHALVRFNVFARMPPSGQLPAVRRKEVV